MNRTILSLALTSAAALSLNFGPCSSEPLPAVSSDGSGSVAPSGVITSVSDECGYTSTIFAGQHIDSGVLDVTSDADNLYVTATGTNGWSINAMHLYAGVGPVPTNGGGNPAPGQFPYAEEFTSPVGTWTMTVALADLDVTCGTSINVAVHLEMVQVGSNGSIVASETGWGYGDNTFSGTRWGWWFVYEICCPEPVCPVEETTIYAGQTIDSGTVAITNDADNLYITVTGTNGWTINAAHVYAGTGPVPTNGAGVPAPGQFPYTEEFGSPVGDYTFAIPLADINAGCADTLTVAVHTEMVQVGSDGSITASETGWGFGDPFGGPRWGWSFQYDVCCG